MKTNPEALRLPDPILVRVFRAGMIDEVKSVQIDDKRNVTIHFDGIKEPAFFRHLVDVGWVLEGACGQL